MLRSLVGSEMCIRDRFLSSAMFVAVEGQSEDSVVGLIDPGSFRGLDSLLRQVGGELEILDLSVALADDHDDLTCEPDEPTKRSNQTISHAAAAEEPPAPKPSAPVVAVKGQTCKNCGVSFASRDEHREHFKSDWHRFNLTRKSQGQEPVSLQEYEFEQMVI
eukprot:TRINITY_DN15130_c0_g1_i4.p1 TRINITY_DN15130_c0_g1~~TRINITY_DN15130_c0_g1_i4.p1  ORF type:complete len:162 (-),score=38.29 TRINITY_DN15130_c0_g1_i4:308-793(-)